MFISFVALVLGCSAHDAGGLRPNGMENGTSGGSSGAGGGVGVGGGTAGGASGGVATGGNENGTVGGSSSGGANGNAGSSGANGGSSGANGGNGNLVPWTPPECADDSSSALPETAPQLTVGQFVNISPPGVPFNSKAEAITQGMTIDPCNSATIYVCVGDAQHGIYRSTDGGGTWTQMDFGGGFPVRVRVDPEDPLHLYVGAGVRGGGTGFYHTTDGGQTWTMPQGFVDFANDGGSYDVYHVEPDPTDFDHVLLSFHSAWKGESENGVVESFDGGLTWEKANLPGAGATSGTDVYMLYEPTLGIGNPQTWLFGTQQNGHWRTTNSGDTWTKVENTAMQHGGGGKYYTTDGTLYISSAQGILRSTNNGLSFTKIGPGNNGYLSIIGDGTRLYAAHHFNSRYETALESDDTTWDYFNLQEFDEGAFEMVIDHENGILYAAQIRAGVWALKLE
jgi:hypothetical protein